MAQEDGRDEVVRKRCSSESSKPSPAQKLPGTAKYVQKYCMDESSPKKLEYYWVCDDERSR
jgi:hypothetical protein